MDRIYKRITARGAGPAAAFLSKLTAAVSTAVVVLIVASFGLSEAVAQNGALAEYRLGAGDRLTVTVFGHPQESGEFEVDGSGNLAYPLLGRVEARGLTVPEVQEILRKELNDKFIVDPRVSVEVLNYRPFYISGEVNRAGSYPYVAGLTVRRAVAIAGGFTRRAQREPVTVIRERAVDVDKLDTKLDKPVLPGDIIEVQRRLF